MPQAATRPGDWLLAALLAAACAASGYYLWYRPGSASHVLLYQEGRLLARWPLRLDHDFNLYGPLGLTRVEVRHGQARIAADPSPRQYCVQQGWLSRPGSTALCLPNRTAITLDGQAEHDSLAF